MTTLYPKSVEALIELFSKFPGVGPRQANRFVLYLLRQNKTLIAPIAELLKNVEENIGFCSECFRVMDTSNDNTLCSFCADEKRDPAFLAVVEKESDMQNIEKLGTFSGRYHILGGVIQTLDPESPQRLHLKELHSRIAAALAKTGSAEVLLATSATTEGDMTALYIERILAPLKTQYQKFRITRLGRGLSSGSELEYADDQTLRNALANRK